jgi:uncharacterized membrane protein
VDFASRPPECNSPVVVGEQTHSTTAVPSAESTPVRVRRPDHADPTHADSTHTDPTHADSTHADSTHTDPTHADSRIGHATPESTKSLPIDRDEYRSVERVEVTTVVYADVDVVYDFLLDFPGYAAYSEHLRRVRQRGDGNPGTEYALEFAWWKIEYTANSKVTGVDRPRQIDWRITKDIDATGHWRVTETDPPAGESTATRVEFAVEYDPDSARVGSIDVPRFVSLSWIVEKVKPKIEAEATRIVERVVEDLEGSAREVELSVDTKTTDG